MAEFEGFLLDAGTVEEFPAVDPGLLADCVRLEGGSGPNGEISIFAGFERTDAGIDAQLFGGIDRDELQGFFLRNSAVFDRFGGFGVKTSRQIAGIRIEGNENAAIMHDRSGVGNGIEHFEFICPPIGETGGAGAVARDLIGDFVTFQNVLESGDADVE